MAGPAVLLFPLVARFLAMVVSGLVFRALASLGLCLCYLCWSRWPCRYCKGLTL